MSCEREREQQWLWALTVLRPYGAKVLPSFDSILRVASPCGPEGIAVCKLEGFLLIMSRKDVIHIVIRNAITSSVHAASLRHLLAVQAHGTVEPFYA